MGKGTRDTTTGDRRRELVVMVEFKDLKKIEQVAEAYKQILTPDDFREWRKQFPIELQRKMFKALGAHIYCSYCRRKLHLWKVSDDRGFYQIHCQCGRKHRLGSKAMLQQGTRVGLSMEAHRLFTTEEGIKQNIYSIDIESIENK
jgi:hypothetical protein